MHGIKHSLWALNNTQIKNLLTKNNAMINIGKYLPLDINGKTKLNIKFLLFVFTTIIIVLVITIGNTSVIIVIIIYCYYY